MMDREQLKLRLEQIAENHFELPTGDCVQNYWEPMLTYIGDPDAYLRDELICTAFYEWIVKRQYFDAGTLCALLNNLIGEKCLFYRIGNDADDTVFTRSFSMLAIAQILSVHKKTNVLDTALFDRAKEAIYSYLMREMDFRGFLPEYGWAHAAAHGADALVELVQCVECSGPDMFKALQCIKRVLQNGRYILCHEEDERLASVVITMLGRCPSPVLQVQSWLEELLRMDDMQEPLHRYMARVSTKQFVRSVFFRLLHHQDDSALVKMLRDTEKCLNRFA